MKKIKRLKYYKEKYVRPYRKSKLMHQLIDRSDKTVTGELADFRFFVKTIDFHNLKFLPVNPAIQTHQKT